MRAKVVQLYLLQQSRRGIHLNTVYNIPTLRETVKAWDIFCPIILMSVNTRSIQTFQPSSPHYNTAITIRMVTHTHERCLLYNKAITIKAVREGVLSNTAGKLHLTQPSWPCATCKHTEALRLTLHTRNSMCPKAHLHTHVCVLIPLCFSILLQQEIYILRSNVHPFTQFSVS